MSKLIVLIQRNLFDAMHLLGFFWAAVGGRLGEPGVLVLFPVHEFRILHAIYGMKRQKSLGGMGRFRTGNRASTSKRLTRGSLHHENAVKPCQTHS